ncbi:MULTISPECIES: threonine ammonia-lyase IlvA [Planococcus]|uniref:L-threonine dehydratase n=2 Tax=Planococcus TaxID=1372 RepID=A0ABM5WWT1_9BACL|nr:MULTISPECIES: threonine ammonia-lyase IlvA [Planococcus]ALS78792.1 threonine dehydratase [Planococcus kocurii]AQU79253.1 threonine dehydratase [Planococcus faecalis]KAA0957620.1 threonine ammonia-lyase IlvA [Planococcus sp. ANT_H30]MDJ0332367.1 threonine ammonia-lyase IlvA [Planococcus sp. S3-L1]
MTKSNIKELEREVTLTKVSVEEIMVANQALKDVVIKTPLQKNELLSARYECNVYLKREDLQIVRSFKLRGAYNFIRSLNASERAKGVVCASAGNHAQGVAYSCFALGIEGKIFMPLTTPRQKISQVKRFGGDQVSVELVGDTFDDSFTAAMAYCNAEEKIFVHPFNDNRIIAGQGTVAVEILNDMQESIDYMFCAIGGGGLASGVGSYLKGISPKTKLIGVEPEGAPGMKTSITHGKVTRLDTIDTFVDGAAVKQVGDLSMAICSEVLDDIVLIPEGKVCTTILQLYNENAIVAEPAGALSVAALDFYKEEIKGKNIVCVISGGNNDIERMQEIKEKSLIYEGLKHYFIVTFPQRAGALRKFMGEVLGDTDDITHFEYTKRTNREQGPVLVGIELKCQEDYEPLVKRMAENGFPYKDINNDSLLFNLLI